MRKWKPGIDPEVLSRVRNAPRSGDGLVFESGGTLLVAEVGDDALGQFVRAILTPSDPSKQSQERVFPIAAWSSAPGWDRVIEVSEREQ